MLASTISLRNPLVDAATERRRGVGPFGGSPRILSLGIALTLLVLMSSQATAATYYVDPQTGSDGNNGTSSSSAWETIPGTRNTGNSGFLRNQWGGVTQSAKVQCGDTVLLKGGSTYSASTVSNGGAWRIDPSYYTNSCTAASPITIRVATSGEWGGSTGHFLIDGTGMENTSFSSNPNGACNNGGGACGLIDIESLDGVIFGGISSSQRVRITVVTKNPAGATHAILLLGRGQQGRDLQLGWLELAGKTGYDYGSAIGIGDLNYSWVHDVLIHDWRGAGINVGFETAYHRVHSLILEDITALNTGNSSSTDYNVADPFRFGGAEFSDAKAGGGVWCIRCVTGNGMSTATNSFGCLSGGEDGLLRFRDSALYGNGRNTQISSGWGTDSAGDGVTCPNGTLDNLPTQTVMFFRTVVYNNRRGSQFPHNGGSMYFWNSTLFREPLYPNVCAESMGVFNSIIDAGGRTGPIVPVTNCGQDRNFVAPVFMNTFIRGASTGSSLTDWHAQCTSDNRGSWTGTSCQNRSCPNGQTCRIRAYAGGTTISNPVGALVGNGNVVGATAPGFVSTGGACDTAFASGSGAPGYSDCDFHLSTGSPAIDPPKPLFVLLAKGAGSNSSTITVKASTPEPEQLTNGGPYSTLGFNYSARPHIADPRTYFISPQNHPWAKGDVIQIVGTCSNGNARHGAPGRAQIVSMTSSTITLDDTCTWADGAGVHWPFTGSGPDMGAYEVGLDGGAVSPPRLISVEPITGS